ncbi:piercer of microtubule wall 2 protein [Pelmatolapia mariae]|uniref:piercer of microtubule wall 2 protein n=1 Tax=Pelmatolapia mariae TaxID=158779 RepID=UPI003211E6DA
MYGGYTVLVVTVRVQSVMEEQRVQTCDFYRTDPDLPHRFNNPDCFHGYEQVKSHPLYRTSNQTYGSKKPALHEMQGLLDIPSVSELMLHSGMFRHHGFNTSVDRSRVMVSMETQHRRANFHYLYHYGNQRSKNVGSSK